jgi:hypothetical protein
MTLGRFTDSKRFMEIINSQDSQGVSVPFIQSSRIHQYDGQTSIVLLPICFIGTTKTFEISGVQLYTATSFLSRDHGLELHSRRRAQFQGRSLCYIRKQR